MDKPRWWSKVEDLSWDKMKGSLTEEWQKLSVHSKKLEQKVAEKAIAFGHGAKSALDRTADKANASLDRTAEKANDKADEWSDEVEKRLKADWEATHKDAADAWDGVREAVKLGWEKTIRR